MCEHKRIGKRMLDDGKHLVWCLDCGVLGELKFTAYDDEPQQQPEVSVDEFGERKAVTSSETACAWCGVDTGDGSDCARCSPAG